MIRCGAKIGMLSSLTVQHENQDRSIIVGDLKTDRGIMKDKKETKHSRASRSFWLFLIYIAIVVKLVWIRGPIADLLEGLGVQTIHRKIRTANLVPFHTIKLYLRWGNTYWSTINLVGNVVVFIPLGFLLPHAFRKLHGFVRTFFASLLIILFIEGGQLLSGVGEFDVDDILLNMVGAMIGYAFYAVQIARARVALEKEEAFEEASPDLAEADRS